MTDIILSAHKKLFKLERHAVNAIKDKPGYVVEKRDGGFVGIKADTGKLSNKFNAIRDYQNDIVALKADNRTKKDQSGLDILCPSCGLSHFITTAEYDPDENANPAMIDLKSQYKEWGWDELINDSSMGYGCIVCPECGSAMCPGGKLRVAE